MHLGVPTKDNFRPKSNSGFNLPMGLRKYTRVRNWKRRHFAAVAVFLLLLNAITSKFLDVAFLPIFNFSKPHSFSHLTRKEALAKKQDNHGLFKKEIKVKDRLIYPSVEHAPLLRELTLNNLFKSKPDPTDMESLLYFYEDDIEDKNNEIKEKTVDDESNPLNVAKKSFKQHGRKVFNGKSPEIVLVTGIDFENFELGHLTKVVQNRVDYAQANGYGLYVRWIQEFIPLLQEYKSDKSWAKLFVMRAAIHAFPNAKYFWYLDESAFIMRNDIELKSYMLDPEVLDPIMLRDTSIVPPSGAIKTYKHVKAENVKFIITQTRTTINTDSFILVNDVYGRGLLEFWSDPLFRKYPNFPEKDASALMHILQWHPVLLSKTAIIPGRTIASLHSGTPVDDPNDLVHYIDGDLLVNFKGCAEHHTCELVLDSYWKKTHEEKK
ncbi:unnamed protein product [Kuraishia capsulata CBS 1993]|uniref:Alpha-1,6-mannosyltransferase MNN11 n=1 Tax=Kuraishia capsulata CBS 1993 TaxID=1382522 RepID=W6MGW8_9ASCO|nr:uncharacterized protein KUCA_T00001414001 [Kuraishia capsulata CBS 1993]CDK25444.1 unnamed protein product [Kuraishia capsulata CBS 1993]